MQYTVTDVHARTVQAASTLRKLPGHKVKGYGSSWPEVVREVVEEAAVAAAQA